MLIGVLLRVVRQFAQGKRHDESRLIIVETAIYRVFMMIYRIFAIYNFHQKTLTEPY